MWVMFSMFIDDFKYFWLKDFGLGFMNKGVFYGVWDGIGEVFIVYCFVEVEYIGIKYGFCVICVDSCR